MKIAPFLPRFCLGNTRSRLTGARILIGLRISVFGFLSAFDLRPSDFLQSSQLHRVFSRSPRARNTGVLCSATKNTTMIPKQREIGGKKKDHTELRARLADLLTH